MKEKVSVIVPIYKVEKYIKKCIDSLVNQTYKNLEIILVDDGSPDKCGEICDEYAKIDKRIKVLHKKNGGLSDARNKGVEVATGKYVAFVDSDDYVENDYIEYLLELLKRYDADISIILPYKVDERYIDNRKNKKEKIVVYEKEDALITMLYQKEFDNAAWGKLYKKNIVNGIEFPFGKLYEDIGTTYKYLLKSNKIVYSNKEKYFYLQRSDSIMGKPFKIKDMDYIYQSEILMKDKNITQNKKIEKAAICRYLNANFSVLLKAKKSDNKEIIKEIKRNIKEKRLEVLLDINSRLKTKIAIILTYIGVI